MRVDLVLTGANDIRAGLRGVSSDLDNLNKKLDATQAKLNGLGGGGGSASASGSSTGGSSGSIPPIAIPPTIPPIASSAATQFKGFAVGASTNIQAKNIANTLLGMLPVEAKIAAQGLAAVAVAAYEASKAITAMADFQFIARGAGGGGNQLAGISRAVGVDLSEAGQIASNKPGGAAQVAAEIDTLRRIKDDNAAAVYAKNRGIEGYRAVRSMTDSQYEQAKNQPTVGDAAGRVNDRVTTELNLAIAHLSTDVQTALIPVIVNLAVIMTALVTAIDIGMGPLPMIGKLLGELYDKLTGGHSAADKISDAADTFKDSVNQLTNSSFGGGNRTRGAFPAAWQWSINGSQTIDNINKLGGI